MVGNLFKCYAVNTPAGLFDQIKDQKMSGGLQEILQRADGAVDPTFVAIMSSKPMLEFTTTAILQALTWAGIDGLAISAAVSLYLQKVANKGTRASGSSHMKLSGDNGILVPKTLKVSQRGVAELNYDLYLISSDGETAPFSIATGQALTGSPSVSQLFTLGPVTFNGEDWGGVQSTEIDFGLKVECKDGDGDVYPTLCYIEEREPKVKLEGLDATLWATAGVIGQNIDSTTSVKFLGLEQGGTRSGTDVTVGIAAGRYAVEDVGGDEQKVNVTLTPISDGNNAILAIS